ncbi:hypothetical protein PORY_001054 [Pneumocystis oryctolagi]|uniref:Uncharacterized protein n=1 Tax=Pneumocystis oryctolagi TaxID=42067 RepID=A0ACB7CEX6_9ASCO|nr:hypothetical protein PORY_001054 [Pneumocystis oryctolagi]
MSDVSINYFNNFIFDSVLNEDSRLKYIVFLGYIFGVKAILIVEKTAFDPLDITSFTVKNSLHLDLIEKNDVYHLFSAAMTQYNKEKPQFKITLIYPSSETHIKKYSKQSKFKVEETPEIYESYVKPYIETMKGPRIQWVYNILDHITEQEHILFENPDKINGFIILPDLKWDRKIVSALYYIAIVNRRDISSLRDLKKEHIPLLHHIKQASLESITQKHPKIHKNQLKLFVHYQPSYYHFHVHITHIDYDTGDGTSIGKAYLLEEIIDYLEKMPDQISFSQRTITYFLGEKSDLWINVFSKIQENF